MVLVAGCGTTTQITEGNGESRLPVLSEDGRYVLFESDASDLVPGDTNGEPDLFTLDRQTGTTTRITDGDGDTPESTPPFEADMSADGRYVAYQSFASDIVDGDDNGHADVFVWDRTTGTTERITDGNEDSGRPTLSADGRHVAYMSLASDLVPDDGGPLIDIFSWDRTTGTTVRITDGVGNSLDPAISGDGRHIGFWTDSFDGGSDIWTWDRDTGITTQVSGGGSSSLRTALSTDGRYVTFSSDGEPSEEGEESGLFLWDRMTGTTSLIAADADPRAGGAISGDGRRVALTTGSGVALWQRNEAELTDLPGDGTPAISADGYDVAVETSGDISIWSDRALKPAEDDSPAPG